MQVQQLLLFLDEELQKIAPKVVVHESKVNVVRLNILNLCEFLALLHLSNQRVARLPREAFQKPSFHNYYRPLDVFRMHF
jgi:hypothetical protein